MKKHRRRLGGLVLSKAAKVPALWAIFMAAKRKNPSVFQIKQMRGFFAVAQNDKGKAGMPTNGFRI
jgi:hypothetical protein